MQSYLYDDIQSEELPEYNTHESEADYWTEKFEAEQQLKAMDLHK